jgi:peptidoglycan/LPS O-acetylase OafA/YrhL
MKKKRVIENYQENILNRNKNFDFIDLCRGLSALIVCVSHLRAFIFDDFSNSGANDSFSGIFFYLITGYGSQAVVLFFVLSGFLVAGPEFYRYRTNEINFSLYLLKRFTRLYVVLVPSLILTFFLDHYGMKVSNFYYDGHGHEFFTSGPILHQEGVYEPLTFLLNLFFLQDIFVPTYGTNTPLWSLSREAMFYLSLPVILMLTNNKNFTRNPVFSSISLMAVILVYSFVGYLVDLIIWIVGFLCYVFYKKFGQIRKARVFSVFVFFFSFVLVKVVDSGLAINVFFSISFAFVLVSFIEIRLNDWFMAVSSFFSKISYSLYLTHFPVQFFVISTVDIEINQSFGISGLIIFILILALNVLVAAIFYYFFESKTEKIYLMFKSFLKMEKKGV